MERLFIKNYKDLQSPKVRSQYGMMCGIVGIIINVILSSFKIIFGFLTGIVSLIFDGANNFVDFLSSLATILGFKISKKPADEKHPFGYWRAEYITGLIVSVLIIVTGVLLFKEAITKIIQKDIFNLNLFYVTIGILIGSIVFKLFYFFFLLRISKKLKTKTLKASAFDALFDSFISLGVIISIIIYKFVLFNIDGYLSLLISLIIFLNGLKFLKETSSPLLGEKPKREILTNINKLLNNHDFEVKFLDYHDISVHNYGSEIVYVVMHMSFDNRLDVNLCHNYIDFLEKQAKLLYGYHLTIHYDPVDITDPYYEPFKVFLTEGLKTLDEELSFHELRVDSKLKKIYFEVEVSNIFKKLSEKALKEKILLALKDKTREFSVEIVFDYIYYK